MITGAFRFNPDKVFYEMDAIVAWLEANGVTAKHVPTDARVVFDGERMTVDVYLLNAEGQRYLTPGTEVAARDTVTVPLLIEPPDFRALCPLGAEEQ